MYALMAKDAWVSMTLICFVALSNAILQQQQQQISMTQ